MFFKDIRDYQIVFLLLFLLLGISSRDWTLRADFILVIVLSCLATQYLLSLVTLRRDRQKQNNNLQIPSLPHNWKVINSLRSALITALGLCLLLRANSYTTVVLASCLAIGSKFICRWEGKHFFNPANFGIIAALLLTNDAWVSPGQWGTDWWYLLLFLGTGSIVLKRVGRWDTSAAFFLVYTLLEIIRNFWLGWSFDVVQHHLMSGSLLLFVLFMLTDPRSIPNATISRLIWSVSIAILAFLLQHQLYLQTSIFWALFILSPLTIWLDRVWQAPRFNWSSSSLAKLVGEQKVSYSG